mmetsp:Transcript_29474/g.69327  ORF Transcript_29474/g.69327 Transcript_29474/m.69327 type:complete len:279 (-) Transcript_29474:568-1404(-)
MFFLLARLVASSVGSLPRSLARSFVRSFVRSIVLRRIMLLVVADAIPRLLLGMSGPVLKHFNVGRQMFQIRIVEHIATGGTLFGPPFGTGAIPSVGLAALGPVGKRLFLGSKLNEVRILLSVAHPGTILWPHVATDATPSLCLSELEIVLEGVLNRFAGEFDPQVLVVVHVAVRGTMLGPVIVAVAIVVAIGVAIGVGFDPSSELFGHNSRRTPGVPQEQAFHYREQQQPDDNAAAQPGIHQSLEPTHGIRAHPINNTNININMIGITSFIGGGSFRW